MRKRAGSIASFLTACTCCDGFVSLPLQPSLCRGRGDPCSNAADESLDLAGDAAGTDLISSFMKEATRRETFRRLESIRKLERPSALLAPTAVLEHVFGCLQNPDYPSQGAGLEQAFRFSAVDDRSPSASSGPIQYRRDWTDQTDDPRLLGREAFEAVLRRQLPFLISAEQFAVTAPPCFDDDYSVAFKVTVTTALGVAVPLEVQLRRARCGSHKDCWLVERIIPEADYLTWQRPVGGDDLLPSLTIYRRSTNKPILPRPTLLDAPKSAEPFTVQSRAAADALTGYLSLCMVARRASAAAAAAAATNTSIPQGGFGGEDCGLGWSERMKYSALGSEAGVPFFASSNKHYLSGLCGTPWSVHQHIPGWAPPGFQATVAGLRAVPSISAVRRNHHCMSGFVPIAAKPQPKELQPGPAAAVAANSPPAPDGAVESPRVPLSSVERTGEWHIIRKPITAAAAQHQELVASACGALPLKKRPRSVDVEALLSMPRRSASPEGPAVMAVTAAAATTAAAAEIAASRASCLASRSRASPIPAAVGGPRLPLPAVLRSTATEDEAEAADVAATAAAAAAVEAAAAAEAEAEVEMEAEAGCDGPDDEAADANIGSGQPLARGRCCAAPGCARQPTFGVEGERPTFCASHKTAPMVDVVNRRCTHASCTKRPSYGPPGKRAVFCASHRGPDMVDVMNARCHHSKCSKQPRYGMEGSRACYCAVHKEPGMVDVKHPRCLEPSCSRQPTFAYEGEKARFCSAHRASDMVDVKNPRCSYPACGKRPRYGVHGERRARTCASHRSDDMVDLTSLQRQAKRSRSESSGSDTGSSKSKGGGDRSGKGSGKGSGKDGGSSDGRATPALRHPRWQRHGGNGGDVSGRGGSGSSIEPLPSPVDSMDYEAGAMLMRCRSLGVAV